MCDLGDAWSAAAPGIARSPVEPVNAPVAGVSPASSDFSGRSNAPPTGAASATGKAENAFPPDHDVEM
jgi:hypothetical protein